MAGWKGMSDASIDDPATLRLSRPTSNYHLLCKLDKILIYVTLMPFFYFSKFIFLSVNYSNHKELKFSFFWGFNYCVSVFRRKPYSIVESSRQAKF